MQAGLRQAGFPHPSQTPSDTRPTASVCQPCMLFSRMQRRPDWGTLALARPIRLSTSRTGLSPVMAAEQFLPPGKLETVSFVDTFGSPPFMQSRNQHRHAPARLRFSRAHRD